MHSNARVNLIFFPKYVPARPQDIYTAKEASKWWQAERAKTDISEATKPQNKPAEPPNWANQLAGQNVALNQRA